VPITCLFNTHTVTWSRFPNSAFLFRNKTRAHWLGCVCRRPSARGVWCGWSLNMIVVVTERKVFSMPNRVRETLENWHTVYGSQFLHNMPCDLLTSIESDIHLTFHVSTQCLPLIHVNSFLLSVSNSFRYRSPSVMIKIFVAFASFLSIPGNMLPLLVTIALRKQSSTLWRGGYISKIDISTRLDNFHGTMVRGPRKLMMREPLSW